MAAKLRVTLQNLTNQNVTILQTGIFTTRRMKVKPKAVKTAHFTSWLCRHTTRYLQVQVAAGDSTGSQCVRVKCDGTNFESFRGSQYIIEISQDREAVVGAGMKVDVAVRYTAGVPTTSRGRLAESSGRTLSESSLACNRRHLSITDGSYGPPPLPTDGNLLGVSSPGKFVLTRQSSLPSDCLQSDLWLRLKQRSFRKISELTSSSNYERARDLRDLVLSAELPRTSTAGSDSEDGSVPECSAAHLVLKHNSRLNSSLPSMPTSTIMHNSRLNSSLPSMSTSTESGTFPSTKPRSPRSIDFSRKPCDWNRDVSGKHAKKIMHRDDLLELLSSGLGGSNPFIISPTAAVPARAKLAQRRSLSHRTK
uniref:Uncharacterized protein n=1 Tax=Pyramimonas obovata TaxID=1411642 RepID=A0A7S0RA60_9CHLO|eukprot:CAMPEP_0118935346 /NCGR_PEP_ID=MMETSP1169-20130426/15483_1 /TAXON_ID=36882 /ORGANISM="Pyramimonas obovata, Strain CCMP722" /LENGTH=364 /DNA_ID=CAMNT_0006878365 /DNA_START=45 /DNA_END=1139 /DNA_ORIENTATION=-